MLAGTSFILSRYKLQNEDVRLRLLYISDLHYSLGPQEPMRPELRKYLSWAQSMGETFAERLEGRLREEAEAIQHLTRSWIRNYGDSYDLVINGGDNALPLHRHEDRMAAAETVWRDQLSQFGERHFIALSGNHELGHGYNPDPESYRDLLLLRKRLFDRPVNLVGYGLETHEEVQLLSVDSELIHLAERFPDNPLFAAHIGEMKAVTETALRHPGTTLLVTHNTTRVQFWLRRNEMWQPFAENGRRLVLIGGHYHVPRFSKTQRGMEIHWAGGGSYPEPLLRFMTRVPFTGLLNHGAGAVEAVLQNGNLDLHHMPFKGVILPLSDTEAA
ncbi:hypothetical protein GF324_02570 [bacterium]|nr:hypothetical protein [bacterium]